MSLLDDEIWTDESLKRRIMTSIMADLKSKGYPTEDLFLDRAANGDVRVYIGVIRLSRQEFLNRYSEGRKVTLGNMCEVEIPRYSNKTDG